MSIPTMLFHVAMLRQCCQAKGRSLELEYFNFLPTKTTEECALLHFH